MLRNKSLSFQLSFLILSVAFVISITLYGYNFYISRNIILEEVTINAKSKTLENVNKLDAVVSNAEKIVHSLRFYVENTNFDIKQLDLILKKLVEENKEIYGSCIAFEPYKFDSSKKLISLYYYHKGDKIEYSDLSSEEYNYPTQEWFIKARDGRKPIWSEPYFDEGGGNIPMTTFSVPLFRTVGTEREFLGVVTCDIALDWLKDYIDNINIYKSGYAFLTSKEGRIIAHRDYTLVMKTTLLQMAREQNNREIDDLYKKMMKGKADEHYFNSFLGENDYYAYFAPLKSNGWYLTLLFPREEIFASLTELGIKMVIFGSAGFLLLFFIIVFIANNLSKSLNVATSSAEAIAECQLKTAKQQSEEYAINTNQNYLLIDIDTKANKNEIVRLFRSVTKMTSILYSLIDQVQKSGLQVSSAATEIAASARELETTVAEQAASTKEVSATSRQISNRSEELTEAMMEVSKDTSKATQIATNGRYSLSKMEDAMHNLLKSTSSISAKLSVISKNANKISNVVIAINKISEQTNLLSFNAAIEAEKAGEFGRGFAIVAREIGRLADSTSISTEDIDKMVKEMQSSVASGVMEMDKFTQETKRNVQEIVDIAQNLEEIIESVSGLENQYTKVSNGMLEQADFAEEISDTMNQLAQTAQQTKDSLSEFRIASQQLQNAVINMKDEVSKFIL